MADLNPYQLAFIKRIRNLPVTEHPHPWTRLPPIAIGGLTAIGFIDDLHALLVLSHNGRGLFDCTTGERIARDPDPAAHRWSHLTDLTADAIGPALGRAIPIAGIHGGGLHRVTPDSWSVDAVYPDWPDAHLLLNAPGAMIYDESRANRCCKIADAEEINAYGFSPNGQTLALAESHTLTLWSRHPK